MVSKEDLQEALEDRKSRMSGKTKGKGTHYFRFEKEEDQKIYNAIAEVVGSNSPSVLQTKVMEFIAENIDDFEEFV